MKLSDGEKIILLMLADISKALGSKTANIDPDLVTDAIYSNNLWAFNDAHGSHFTLSDDDRPPEVSETYNYLDMGLFIEEGYAALPQAQKAVLETDAAPFGKDPTFRGFDQNNEPHYHIARTIIDRLGGFPSFKGRSLDSHSPSVDAYARMYRVFEPIRATLDRPLNLDELTAILRAKVHPSHR